MARQPVRVDPGPGRKDCDHFDFDLGCGCVVCAHSRCDIIMVVGSRCDRGHVRGTKAGTWNP